MSDIVLSNNANKFGGVGREFHYGYTSVRDIKVNTEPDPARKGRNKVMSIELDGMPVKPTERFWTSMYTQFSEYGLSSQLPNLFDHDEIFSRLSERASNDRLRFCVEQKPSELVAQAVTRPERPIIYYPEACDLSGLRSSGLRQRDDGSCSYFQERDHDRSW